MFDIFNDIPVAVFVTYSPKMVNLFDSWSQSFVRLLKFKSSYPTNSFRPNSATPFSCLFYFSCVSLIIKSFVHNRNDDNRFNKKCLSALCHMTQQNGHHLLVFCCHVTGILHSDWLSDLLVNCVLKGCQLGLRGGG